MDLNALIAYILRRTEVAINRLINSWRDGEIETEPSCTDRFFGSIEESFSSYADIHFQSNFSKDDEYKSPQLHFKVRTLRDRGPKAPEAAYGADICIIVSIEDDLGNSLVKGVLIQAKKDKTALIIRKAGMDYLATIIDPDRSLNEQIDRMLEITSQSYILVYTLQGFAVLKADDAKKRVNNGFIQCFPFRKFLDLLLRCLLGDFNIISSRDELFDRLKTGTGKNDEQVIDKMKKWAKYVLMIDIKMEK